MKSARADSKRFYFLRKFENRGILYVFPILRTALREQKVRCSAADGLFRGCLAIIPLFAPPVTAKKPVLFLRIYLPFPEKKAAMQMIDRKDAENVYTHAIPGMIRRESVLPA